MLIKRPADILLSGNHAERRVPAPPRIHESRRGGCAGWALGGLESPGASAQVGPAESRRAQEQGYSTTEKPNKPQGDLGPTTTSTSSARTRTDPAENAKKLQDASVDGRRRWRRQAADLRARRPAQARAGGPGLPAPVRRGLVDGHSVARHSARRRAQAGRAGARRQVRGVRHRASTRKAHARRAAAGAHWPYVEGLRLDEAMHPLTLLCLGLYGEVLPNQNGAPLRLVVPWKYGFKSGSSRSCASGSSTSSRGPRGTAQFARVRLLLQREPEGGPPALEPEKHEKRLGRCVLRQP